LRWNLEINEASPPIEFDQYELVVLKTADDPPALDEAESEELQRRHLGYLTAMHDAGHLKVAAPLGEQPDERWRGICGYQVGAVDEIRRLASADPAVKADQLKVVVTRSFCLKGAVTFPSSLSGE
jgi:uncharacterized protein YciI